MQSAQSDEKQYHEALVHPALLQHPNPRRVLICGGGEGATAREVLKHPSVTNVVMVDIDARVMELSRQYLPEWNAGVWDDPRFHCVVADALVFLDNYNVKEHGTFDVILVDIVDPLDGSPVRPTIRRGGSPTTVLIP